MISGSVSEEIIRRSRDLYNGGTNSDGTPYIVMEYVDGEPCGFEHTTVSLIERTVKDHRMR